MIKSIIALVTFIIIFICIIFLNKKESFKEEKDLSIAIIIISAPSKLNRWAYEKETWEKYEKESKKYNIDCIFIECVENFTFRANCKESYRPGIFQKTIEALKAYPNYDVYVRTNLSTFIIFPFLKQYIMKHFQNKNQPLLGGQYLNVFQNRTIDFISGTGIVFNKKSRDILVSKGFLKKYYYDYTIPDDVLIGMILNKENVIYVNGKQFGHFLYLWNGLHGSNFCDYDVKQIEIFKYPSIRLRFDNDEKKYKNIVNCILLHFYKIEDERLGKSK